MRIVCLHFQEPKRITLGHISIVVFTMALWLWKCTAKFSQSALLFEKSSRESLDLPKTNLCLNFHNLKLTTIPVAIKWNLQPSLLSSTSYTICVVLSFIDTISMRETPLCDRCRVLWGGRLSISWNFIGGRRMKWLATFMHFNWLGHFKFAGGANSGWEPPNAHNIHLTAFVPYHGMEVEAVA